MRRKQNLMRMKVYRRATTMSMDVSARMDDGNDFFFLSTYAFVQKQHERETVGVFFCGPPTLGEAIKREASAASAYSSTIFPVFKENF